MRLSGIKTQRASNKIFEINEKPFRVLTCGDDLHALKCIEQHIRDLMRRVADEDSLRLEQEKQHTKKYKRLLLAIIEVIDAFDRIFDSIQKKQDHIDIGTKKWIGNFRTVRRLLNKVLDEEGIVNIETLDQVFDPRRHTVAEVINDPSKNDGTIVKEVLKGYMWHNRMLRKSEVIVAQNREDEI